MSKFVSITSIIILLTISEIAGIGGGSSGCIDLNRDMLKILGQKNKKLKKLTTKNWKRKNFNKTVTDIQQVLKIRKMRSHMLKGKIVVFLKNSDIKNCFSIIYSYCPKIFWANLKKYKRLFYEKTLHLK